MKKIVSICLSLAVFLIHTGMVLAESMYGIGANFAKNDDLTVQYLLNDSPAQRAGLMPGDKVVQVNGVNTSNLSLMEAMNIIRGEKASSVNLLVKRGKEVKLYTIIREEIKVNVVNAPKWEEFCPTAYLYAEQQEDHYSIPLNFLLAMSLVGLPVAIHNKNKSDNISNLNYWTARRYAFQEEVKTCQSDVNNQSACFMQVRQLEQAKNAQLQNTQLMEEANRIQNSAALQQNIQAQQQIQNTKNLNNNLNNINNTMNRFYYQPRY